MNEVLKTIESRFSCRGYTGKAVEPSVMRSIVKAGLESPSAKNFQPWKIIAINNKEIVDEMDAEAMDNLRAMEDSRMYNLIAERGGKIFYNAPAIILVLKEKNPQSSWVDIDCGILTQNMTLAATSLGLSSCIVALAAFVFKSSYAEELKEILQWPSGYEFAMGLLVGEGNNTKDPHEIDWGKAVIIDE
ncbi:MAG: nitroreductase family protein [Defluviitaleaceae bacterium]|nr:nitroreductase family protein [Defluviitaleaceae bacterium]